MSFAPILPATGNLGWAFLSRTRETQQEAFDRSPLIDKNVSHFRETIGSIRTAADLVADRRLLTVALGAVGLEEDIDSRAFIRKVLEEGVIDDQAFANRLTDKRYFALADAFRFDLDPPNTALASFADRVARDYRDRAFEAAVGEQDPNLRLALGLERDLGQFDGLSEEAAWFRILGTPPLRRVFEGAFGLPAEFGGIDIDKQAEVMRDRAIRVLGTDDPTRFGEADVQETLIRRFLLRAELDAALASTQPGQVALSLLQSSPVLTAASA